MRRQGYNLEADKSPDASSRSSASSSSEPGGGRTASNDGSPMNREDAEHAEPSARVAIEKQVDLLKVKEKDAQNAELRRRFVGSKQWLYSNLASPIDPSLQNFLRRWLKENELYDMLTFVVTLGQGGLHAPLAPNPKPPSPESQPGDLPTAELHAPLATPSA